nr:MAG TPA: hypothetical protein [Bacteriophage sp.]DAY68860.1 MAG TPA: hypothetical protein [Caudoviricetes sp.]
MLSIKYLQMMKVNLLDQSYFNQKLVGCLRINSH